jgi:hypothetical protein
MRRTSVCGSGWHRVGARELKVMQWIGRCFVISAIHFGREFGFCRVEDSMLWVRVVLLPDKSNLRSQRFEQLHLLSGMGCWGFFFFSCSTSVNNSCSKIIYCLTATCLDQICLFFLQFLPFSEQTFVFLSILFMKNVLNFVLILNKKNNVHLTL